MIEKRGNFII